MRLISLIGCFKILLHKQRIEIFMSKIQLYKMLIMSLSCQCGSFSAKMSVQIEDDVTFSLRFIRQLLS